MRSPIWKLIETRSVTVNVAWGALASLFAISEVVDGLHVSGVSTLGGTLYLTIYGQAVSDDLWVKLSSPMEVPAGDSDAMTIDVPAGLYDNIAYVIEGVANAVAVNAHGRFIE